MVYILYNYVNLINENTKRDYGEKREALSGLK